MQRIALAIALISLAIAVSIAVWLISSSTSAHTDPNPKGIEALATDVDDGFPIVDWNYWQGINPDVIGWISIPDTTVNYPIVQAHKDNPTYYLNHDIYKKYNIYGCIYLDADCAEDGLLSQNAVIFGHHMRHGESMFKPIASYTDKAFASSHSEIYIQTPTEKRKLNVEAASVIRGTDRTKRTQFNNREDFCEWYKTRISEASMRLDKDTTPARITTLVTCSYSFWPDDERTLVYAADTKDIPKTPTPTNIPSMSNGFDSNVYTQRYTNTR